MNEEIQKILETFPFLSFGTLLDTQYLGIVQNCDSQLISIYVLGDIPTPQMRKIFLDMGNLWWWGSNRQLPINIFLKDRFRLFRPYLKHFARKDFNLEHGHAVSLQETIARRVRKKQITIMRNVVGE